MTAQDSSLDALAALGDDLRRRMYAFIRAAHRPITREEAAANVGISRKLAAFHLDKLVAAGLLRARYDKPADLRRAGRAPKIYEPDDTTIAVTIPPRHHDVLSGILLEGILAETGEENARAAALRIARARGETLGATERDRLRPGRLGAERALTLSEEILTRCGFEPTRETPGLLRLSNCPFHPLAAHAPDLVCAINHAYLTGFLHGLGAVTIDAELAPAPGACCVELRTAPRPGAPPSASESSSGCSA